jgi:hypothetical protein
MSLSRRGTAYEVPSYSLTGDVLSFRRCGLQYRYYNRSDLPPSRPVQMWTGEFLHGVLEDSFRLWAAYKDAFPWPFPPSHDDLPSLEESVPSEWARNHIGRLGARIEKTLAAAGRSPRNRQARFNAYRRAAEAVNVLGPDLFPLITTAEEKITGTIPIELPAGSPRNCDRYELKGVVDVISSVRLNESEDNRLVKMVEEAIGQWTGSRDVIVDYKGMRRPSLSESVNDPTWDDHAWQIRTYAWLRSKREDRDRVGCGVIVYLNELFPSRQDIAALREDHASSASDVLAAPGSADHYAILGVGDSSEDDDLTDGSVLTLDFRVRRAVRIIAVDPELQEKAVEKIHEVVREVESRVAGEHADGSIRGNWPATGRNRDCVACDFAFTCPSPSWVRDGKAQRVPAAPG